MLQLLDNPQEKIKVIHVAGTSGKGSTCYLTSMLLIQHGFKTGFHASPHLLDIRERFQINNNLLSQDIFTKYVLEFVPFIEKARETKWGTLSYFEICVCLAFYIFWKEKVDFAVMETGLGGLYDGTNVIKNPNKLVVLTRIGFDHQKVLGYTLSAISLQKAGIIKKGNTVITVQQTTSVLKNYYSTCQKLKAPLQIISENKNFKNIVVSKFGTHFDFSYEKLFLINIHLGLIGKHQVENTSLALTALYELHKKYDFYLQEQKIRLGLQNAFFKGRFEIHHLKHKDLIMDGAHNPQKMKAFIFTLIEVYPNIKFDFLISFSQGKNQISTMKGILKLIVPIAHSITISDFATVGADLLHTSVDAKRIEYILDQLSFKKYSFHKMNIKLLENLLKLQSRHLVITGSLYFIGNIYGLVLSIMKENKQHA